MPRAFIIVTLWLLGKFCLVLHDVVTPAYPLCSTHQSKGGIALQGKSIKYLVPCGVHRYIEEHTLYA